MERFHVIEDAAAILVSKGVYRQAKVYRRGKELFAAYGAGFVRLNLAAARPVLDEALARIAAALR